MACGRVRGLNGDGFHHHDKCRLARPITVPPAGPVIADAPHPRTENGKDGAAVARHFGDEMLGRDGGGDGVDCKAAREGGGVELFERSFGPLIVVVQHSRGHYGEINAFDS